MTILKKGDVVEIRQECEWKYGEPSIYPDEQMWYLTLYLNGSILDEEEEVAVMKELGFGYEATFDRLDGGETIKIEI